MNGKYGSPLTPFPKNIFPPASAMTSSTKETHCLKPNLDQNIEQERLINHQLTLSKDKLKYWLLLFNTQACMPLIHYSVYNNHSHSAN